MTRCSGPSYLVVSGDRRYVYAVNELPGDNGPATQRGGVTSMVIRGAMLQALLGLAIGVPAVTLIFGKSLAPDVTVTIILVGVGVGGLIALTSTFFSLVIPSKVNGYGGCSCGKPKQTITGNTVEQTF